MNTQEILYKIIAEISEIKNLLHNKSNLNQDLLNIIPVSEYNKYYPFPKEGAIRQYIFKNLNNFHDSVIVYFGNRQYIDVHALAQWMKNNNKNIIGGRYECSN